MNLDQTVKNHSQLNQSHAETIFRVRMDGLKPQTTYYCKVTLMGYDGVSHGVESSVNHFTTAAPGQATGAFPPGLAVTLNRMRCKPPDGKAWTTVRVRELRERLGIGAYDPALPRTETISADATATRLGICVGSVHKLIRRGLLPATQLMTSAPWQIPVAALDTEVVRTGIREIVGRRPKFNKRFQHDKSLWLPGL